MLRTALSFPSVGYFVACHILCASVFFIRTASLSCICHSFCCTCVSLVVPFRAIAHTPKYCVLYADTQKPCTIKQSWSCIFSAVTSLRSFEVCVTHASAVQPPSIFVRACARCAAFQASRMYLSSSFFQRQNFGSRANQLPIKNRCTFISTFYFIFCGK